MLFRIRVCKRYPEEGVLLAECYTQGKDWHTIYPDGMTQNGPVDDLGRYDVEVDSDKDAGPFDDPPIIPPADVAKHLRGVLPPR